MNGRYRTGNIETGCRRNLICVTQQCRGLHVDVLMNATCLQVAAIPSPSRKSFKLATRVAVTRVNKSGD